MVLKWINIKVALKERWVNHPLPLLCGKRFPTSPRSKRLNGDRLNMQSLTWMKAERLSRSKFMRVTVMLIWRMLMLVVMRRRLGVMVVAWRMMFLGRCFPILR
jgi:hypothetical protein